jgi:hypothetical protein
MSWLQEPHLITHGVWGPLHYYLMAMVIGIAPDALSAATGLHLVLGVTTPLLVYAFTRAAFAGPRAALLVAASYAIYPIAIRNSLQVRSEVPFVLLLLIGLVFVELARREDGSWKHALGAGLSITLAAMLRYEAWMLIPLLAVILWRKPRLMGVFVACALIHPLFWMVGNAMHSGDPLYSINYAAQFERDYMGKAAIPWADRVVTALTYPLTILRGMTIPAGLVALAGAAVALLSRERCRVWLLPIAGLAVLISWSIARGALVPKVNYTVTIGTMLFPFAAVIWNRLGVERWPVWRVLALGAAIIVLMVLSTRQSVMSAVGLAELEGVNPVPTIQNQETALTLPEVITRHMPTEPALLSDFYGWGVGYYVAMLSQLHRDQTLFVGPNRDVDLQRASAFLARYPEGILMALEGSRLWTLAGIGEGGGEVATVGERKLNLERIHTVLWPPGNPPPELVVFRYRVEHGGGQ